jgi:hypothetical protein
VDASVSPWQRVGASCVRLGVPAVIQIVGEAYKNLDGLYAFHTDIRRGFSGGDAKLLKDGRCRLTVSKPVLKAPMVSALEATI